MPTKRRTQQFPFNMEEFVSQSFLTLKCIRSDLRKATLKDVAVIMGGDVISVMGFGMVASIITTVVRINGIDTLFPFWLVSVVTAYFIYKAKESKIKITGGTPHNGKALIGVVALIAMVFTFCSFNDVGSDYFDTRSRPFQDFDQAQFMVAVGHLIFEYQTRSCGHIALYLIYFRVFGVISAAKNKIKKRAMTDKNKKSKSTKNCRKECS